MLQILLSIILGEYMMSMFDNVNRIKVVSGCYQYNDRYDDFDFVDEPYLVCTMNGCGCCEEDVSINLSITSDQIDEAIGWITSKIDELAKMKEELLNISAKLGDK